MDAELLGVRRDDAVRNKYEVEGKQEEMGGDL